MISPGRIVTNTGGGATDAAGGADLLAVARLPATFSYTQMDTYARCPLRYAFERVYRIPTGDRPVGAFTFGTTAHAAFEAFTRLRRERAAAGGVAPAAARITELESAPQRAVGDR